MQKSFNAIKFIAKMFNLWPNQRTLTSSLWLTAHLHSKNAFMRRTLTQQRLLTLSEYRSAGQIS